MVLFSVVSVVAFDAFVVPVPEAPPVSFVVVLVEFEADEEFEVAPPVVSDDAGLPAVDVSVDFVVVSDLAGLGLGKCLVSVGISFRASK